MGSLADVIGVQALLGFVGILVLLQIIVLGVEYRLGRRVEGAKSITELALRLGAGIFHRGVAFYLWLRTLFPKGTNSNGKKEEGQPRD